VDQLQTLFSGGTIAGLTDAQLLERFTNRRGEEAELAFAGLVARHGPMVLGVCRSLLRNTYDAEDAFQATFLILARKAGSLRRPDLISAWLYGVAHRCACQVRAKNARRKRREAEAAMSRTRAGADADGQESKPADNEEVEALHEEIERLPERYRVAVVLCDLQGLTHEEAGRLLGRPVGTVSSRLSRARERLRGRLSRRGMVLPATVVATTLATNNASAMPVGLMNSTVKIAMTVSTGVTAGVVPASIASLSQGVLRSMLLTKSMISVAVLMGVAAVGTVAVVAQQDTSPPRNASRDKNQARKPSSETPSRGEEAEAGKVLPSETELIYRSEENLRRIGEAIQAHMADGPGEVTDASRFPPSAIFSADGSPLLSWRVVILPYLGEKALYAQFKLDEPWDGPHNKKLLEKMPKVYAPVAAPGYDHLRAVVKLKKTSKVDAPVADAKQSNMTFYQGFTGKGAFFDGTKGVEIREVTDGTVMTLMVAEAETAVPWTKPEDLTYVQGKALPRLGGQFKNGITAVTADGYSRFMPRSIPVKYLEAMITRTGGETFPIALMGEKVRP
jgi:RNA polymerase sigma factor (sigma-70 family)